MQQRVLAVYRFEWKSKASIGKLIGQRFGRCPNRVAAAQNAMFAKQNDVWRIVVLQIAFDVASLAACKVIFKHFNCCARCRS